MKLILRYFTFFIATLSISTALGQTQTSANAEISKSHDQVSFVFGETWIANNPEMAAALVECLNSRISFREEPLNDKYPVLSSYPLMTKNNPNVTGADFANFTPQTFNPFCYNIEFLSDKTQVIRIDGTPFLMIIEAK